MCNRTKKRTVGKEMEQNVFQTCLTFFKWNILLNVQKNLPVVATST